MTSEGRPLPPGRGAGRGGAKWGWPSRAGVEPGPGVFDGWFPASSRFRKCKSPPPRRWAALRSGGGAPSRGSAAAAAVRLHL